MVVGAQGHPDEFIDLGDILAVNRYYGWYTESGRIEEGAAILGKELDSLHARFGKPILVAEFGTDTLPGCHSADAEMWSEEYQAEFIERYLDEIERRPFVVGAHVWNFADFKTSQSILRAGGLNHKGVFTRDRRPKLAAHALRRRWRGDGR
jgi:beta-glucuronidase